MQNKHKVLPGDVGRFCILDKRKGADNRVSRSTITVKISAEPDQYSALDQWPDNFLFAPVEEDYHNISG